jgi:hypothetical protein
MGKPNLAGVWLYAKFNSTQIQKKIVQLQVQIGKLWPFYRTTIELWFWRCSTDLDEKSGEAMTMQTSLNAQQGSSKEGKAQNKFCNLSRVCNAEN